MRLRDRFVPPAIVAAFAGFGLAFALAVADRLAPPDLSRAENRSVVVAAADGAILRPFLASDGILRLPVRVEDVDPLYLKLLIAYEDQRFQGHPGFDALAIARAAWQLAANMRVVSGASTITMQAARLLEPRPRTLPSKMIEVMRALQLEARFTKDEILGLYLTLAPYGGNLEGVRAASLAYFGKEPRRLTLPEAALLVALPQSPERLRPDRDPQAARAGRDKVLARLAERGVISLEEAQEAMEALVPHGRLPLPFLAPHATERLAAAAAPGETILTSIDAPLQSALEALAAREKAFLFDGAHMAAVIADNKSRRIIAILGSADYWAPLGQNDLTRAARSPGSTLKPFIYGIAFDDLALHPASLIDDKPMLFGDYAPRNFDRGFQGTIAVRDALRLSLNVPAVALLDAVGPVKLAASLRNAGATLKFPRSWAAPSLPLALGGAGISLSDLTMLYAAIPNGGQATTLPLRLDQEPHDTLRLFRPAAAWYLTDILKDSILPDGWAMGRGIERGRPIAFKTGTSYGYRDAWTVGFTQRYTVGVWVGLADGSTRPGRFGRNEAAPLMLKIFDLLPHESPSSALPPEDVVIAARSEDLPRAMQRFMPRVRVAESAGLPEAEAPRIMFPMDGSEVLIAEADETIPLKATGGRAPLRWIVDGDILPETPRYQTTFFMPQGLGYSRITVVDAEGRSATSTVRFTREGR